MKVYQKKALLLMFCMLKSNLSLTGTKETQHKFDFSGALKRRHLKDLRPLDLQPIVIQDTMAVLEVSAIGY